jgi:hypothetical protein
MNQREQLIEAAAKAFGGITSSSWDDAAEWEREEVLEGMARAIAVFEGAGGEASAEENEGHGVTALEAHLRDGEDRSAADQTGLRRVGAEHLRRGFGVRGDRGSGEALARIPESGGVAHSLIEGAGSFLPVASDVQETAHTDDEREALRNLIEEERLGWNRRGSGYSIELADAILAAGFHRTVQGATEAPNSKSFGTVQGEPDLMDRLKDSLQPVPKPQGEPSDAQEADLEDLTRAYDALKSEYWALKREGFFDDGDARSIAAKHLRGATAALRAAAETGGEHRG